MSARNAQSPFATIYAAMALALVMAIIGIVIFTLAASSGVKTLGVLLFSSGIGTTPAIWLMYRRAR